jgi:hypothetical protein
MIRKCDGTDPNLVDSEGNTGNCGLEFDDVHHLVICPHPKFTKKNVMGYRTPELKAEIRNTVDNPTWREN